jgi:hypothetical protein
MPNPLNFFTKTVTLASSVVQRAVKMTYRSTPSSRGRKTTSRSPSRSG